MEHNREREKKSRERIETLTDGEEDEPFPKNVCGADGETMGKGEVIWGSGTSLIRGRHNPRKRRAEGFIQINGNVTYAGGHRKWTGARTAIRQAR